MTIRSFQPAWKIVSGILLAFSLIHAQPAPLAPYTLPSDKPVATARLEGQVVTESGNTPLRRVRVTLSSADGGKAAIGVDTDERGNFVIRDIAPGVYSLSAARDGYLPVKSFRKGTVRMPQQFSISGSERVTGLVFRLTPWAVVSGRIRFEDTEPAVNLQVALYRQYHVRGRHGFTAVATTTTNDRGEYRVHGLSAGAYYVAAIFEGERNAAGVETQPPIDANGHELPVSSYTTMFYPDATRLTDALPVRVKVGEELNGIDMYLRTVQRVKLSGIITNGITGEKVSNATIIMERLDSSGTGVLQTPQKVEFDNDDRFHLARIAPGSYGLWVDVQSDKQRLVGRSTLLVNNAEIDDLKLIALPQIQWRGELVFPTGMPQPRGFQPNVVLEPRSERGAVVSGTAERTGGFSVSLFPNETYDVFVKNLPDSYYISQIRAEGGDRKADGLTGSMASSVPFQIIVDSRVARIDGQVQGPNATVWSGANLTLIPDSMQGRLQDYRDATADVNGQFHVTGVAPGRYLLMAWFDEQPCDVYDPQDLDACRASGTTVTVGQGSQQTVELVMKSSQ
jgi:hypothetical protein